MNNNQNNQSPAGQKPNDLTPEPTQQEIDASRDLIIKTFAVNDDSDKIREAIKLIRTPNIQPKQTERAHKLMAEVAVTHALTTGHWLQSITRDDNKFGLAEMRKNLIQEYRCTTASELALVDRIVASYWRSMCYDMKIQDLMKSGSSPMTADSDARLLKEWHRGLELASRELNLTLTMLRSFKQPNIKINVKTDSAYFAQNQQVINQKDQQKPESIDGEIISPK